MNIQLNNNNSVHSWNAHPWKSAVNFFGIVNGMTQNYNNSGYILNIF